MSYSQQRKARKYAGFYRSEAAPLQCFGDAKNDGLVRHSPLGVLRGLCASPSVPVCVLK
jgi:hypothetical protein